VKIYELKSHTIGNFINFSQLKFPPQDSMKFQSVVENFPGIKWGRLEIAIEATFAGYPPARIRTGNFHCIRLEQTSRATQGSGSQGYIPMNLRLPYRHEYYHSQKYSRSLDLSNLHRFPRPKAKPRICRSYRIWEILLNFPRPPGGPRLGEKSTKRSLHAFALHIRAIPVQLLPGPSLFLFLTPTRL
jgi:hypothetical protein